ncbi:S1C family serine protease [Shouchella shacheensis]|uniref:S1C family serine protease n=1 Tax=Shouchella shacheensis TaxID=1649580 RepID=UPI00073FDF54|nr:S1C family serine protease [Shouchella shacheensis]
MKCKHCGAERTRRTGNCEQCGEMCASKKRKRRLVIAAMATIGAGATLLTFHLQGASSATEAESETVSQVREEVVSTDLVSIHEHVYTIQAGKKQGSGFLYEQGGYVLTDALIVEGQIEAEVHLNDSTSYTGGVVGFSEESQVALLFVEELKDRTPPPLAVEEHAALGDEVVALSGRLSEGRAASIGQIIGVDRELVFDSHSYENVYQISTPILAHSSGGPLVAKDAGQVTAMNVVHAQDNEVIAYSIPLSLIDPVIQEWLRKPMDSNELEGLYNNMPPKQQRSRSNASFNGGELDEGLVDETEASHDQEDWYEQYEDEVEQQEAENEEQEKQEVSPKEEEKKESKPEPEKETEQPSGPASELEEERKVNEPEQKPGMDSEEREPADSETEAEKKQEEEQVSPQQEEKQENDKTEEETPEAKPEPENGEEEE